MTLRSSALGFLISCLATTAALAAPAAYMRSSIEAPWDLNGNETQMDSVFGAGNWDDLRYETVNVGTLFSPSTTFVFMEGGDLNADELETFLTANIATIENWVSAGGRLLINAAPNEGDGMSLGFGITLTYEEAGGEVDGMAVNASHPIMLGPATPVGTSWTGSYFSHASVSGGGGFSAILTDADSLTTLGETAFGSGHVVAGGLTLPFFTSHEGWQLQPQVANLHHNIIAYVANVPEPSTLVLAGVGLLGLVTLRWRRRKR